MTDPTILALTEALREHHDDFEAEVAPAPVVASAKRARRRRRVAGAGGVVAAAAVAAIVLSILPGRPTSAPVPADRSTTPTALPSMTTVPHDELRSWVSSLPSTPLSQGEDTLPTVSMDGDRVLLTLGGRSTRLPQGIRALSTPRPTERGWLLIGVTRSPLGLYEHTRVVEVDTDTMSVRELARGRSLKSLLVSPDGSQFAWVDDGTSEPGAQRTPVLHVHELSSGREVLVQPVDEQEVGYPATWADATITFVRNRLADEGGDAHDVRWPITTFDTRSRTWTHGSTRQQFDRVAVVATRSGDTTAIVQAREPGGDSACVYRMVGSTVTGNALGCRSFAWVSAGGRYVLLVDEDAAGRHQLLDGENFTPISVPDQLAEQLHACGWEGESVLFCGLPRKDGSAGMDLRWSVPDGQGQRLDEARPTTQEDAGLDTTIFIN